jgi:Ion channel
MGFVLGVTVAVTVVALLVNPPLPGSEGSGLHLAYVISALLYLVAQLGIVRHLLRRPVVDIETLLGAVVMYLLLGMMFAFAYRAVGSIQTTPPLFGDAGNGTMSEDLFFSFVTLTTTGYGNLVPDSNPGQSMAVLEAVLGQLFLVTAVARVVALMVRRRGYGARRETGDEST